MKTILTGLLSKAYKLDEGKIAEILKDGEENANENEILKAILEVDTERVASLKKQNADNKESFQQGYAKAKKEERQLLEQEIKDQFEVESDKMGIDLITEIVENLTASGSKKGELTDDDVKKHPLYLTAEKNFKKQLTEAKSDYETKISDLQTKVAKENTFAVIKENASAILEGLNPIIPKSAKVSATIRNQFLNELKGYEYEKQADGSWLVTKEGKIVEDSHGHSKNFEDIVKEISESYFEFAENNGGSNAGNEGSSSAGGSGSATVPKFKSQADADAYALNEAVPLEQRIKALEDWSASN